MEAASSHPRNVRSALRSDPGPRRRRGAQQQAGGWSPETSADPAGSAARAAHEVAAGGRTSEMAASTGPPVPGACRESHACVPLASGGLRGLSAVHWTLVSPHPVGWYSEVVFGGRGDEVSRAQPSGAASGPLEEQGESRCALPSEDAEFRPPPGGGLPPAASAPAPGLTPPPGSGLREAVRPGAPTGTRALLCGTQQRCGLRRHRHCPPPYLCLSPLLTGATYSSATYIYEDPISKRGHSLRS